MSKRFLPAAAWDERELVELARIHGTPLYVYDLDQLSATVEAVRSILEPFDGKLYFATMANDRPSVLRHLASAGLGACVNSGPHLDLALRCGFSPADIQFTSTGIRADDMSLLHRLGIRVNIDSLAQLECWFSLGARSAGVRLNAASLRGSGGMGDRIGMETGDLERALGLASDHRAIIDGVHVYVGTNFQTPADMFPTLDALFRIAERVPDLRYVNIGGGIGVDYGGDGPGFDLGLFGGHVGSLLARLRAVRGDQIQLILEPGRSLTASCAAFVVQVTDVKELNGETFLTVDGSIAQFPRPFHHPETQHRLRLLTPRPNMGPVTRATVTGRTTFSRDILGYADVRRATGPGDYVLIEQAGAYSQSMASRFLGQPEPHEVLLGDQPAELVAAE